MDRVTVKPFAESCENVSPIFQKLTRSWHKMLIITSIAQKLARWEPSKNILNAEGKLKTPQTLYKYLRFGEAV